MKLGVMSALFTGRDFTDVLEYIAGLGLDAIEIPVGAYPGTPFFAPDKVLASASRQKEIKAQLRDHGLELSGLAVHGNPVHPGRAHAKRDHASFVNAVKLAPKLGTDIVITFSGCPGGSASDRMPNWVTCAWPPDNLEILAYQWEDVLVPYWADQAKLARKHAVRVAWEAHPGFCVYNPDTLIRLATRAHKASGVKGRKVLGANLDPSHFFWQGIDPILAARALGEAGLLFYVHAKDTELDPHEGPVNGYLDARPYGDLKKRSWTFRTCGYGHGDEFWKPFVSMLRRYGYDGVLSIEHEDPFMSVGEGFEKAVEYLSGVVIEEKAGEAWWV
ncbi:MAG: sugar phosphate isomerase/epimerase [Phycisphaerales bacterium]|nr:sugar phosphate isomerase/epimerase [Phycisphaerae bacterium]NNF43732.1 sugar phosphate isomerase/epimerase [Phycisphaerales bacterium]NNM25771.1 sugar phosphate isomerase/epimerase [Phycisphaerales bacterium]